MSSAPPAASFENANDGVHRVPRAWMSGLRRCVDDVAALLFPETCRVCGAADIDASSRVSRGWPTSRLQNGRLRRAVFGPLHLPLRLLCHSCCQEIRPRRLPAASEALDVVAFEPSPALFRLVHALKYDGVVELVPWLAARMARAARRALPRGPIALVPVPLHPQRLAERGFNQSTLLAQAVGRHLGVPVWELLERCRPTAPLARLAHAERRAHVKDAFVRRGPLPSQGLRLVLVDDVATTGATRDAARAALGAQVLPSCGFLGICRAAETSSWRYEADAKCGRRSEPTHGIQGSAG